MAHLRCDVFSDTLGLSTSFTAILPQPVRAQIGMGGSDAAEPPPVLYLLHGLSDDDTTWLRRTSIERYVAELGIAVVMPAVGRSWYADERQGLDYWTYVSEELPELVSRFFRVSSAREDTFAAGLSMGGYGAVKLGLRHPERFAAVASMSGALDLGSRSLTDARDDDPRMWERVFGDRVPDDDDLFTLLDRADPATLPALWVDCGTADRLYGDALRFVERCGSRGIPVTSSWIEGADHEWSLWDRQIQQILAWLPLRDRR